MLSVKRIENLRLDKLVRRHRSALESFWGHPKLKEPIVLLLDSRKEIDRIRNMATDARLVGWFWRERFILILDPDRFKSDSCFAKKDFDAILLHELSHYYFYQMTGGSAAWFDEGLACVIAGQGYGDERPTPSLVKKMLDCYFDFDRSLFAVSRMTVAGILRDHGRKKVIAFLRQQKGRPRAPEEFTRSLKKHFGIDQEKLISNL